MPMRLIRKSPGPTAICTLTVSKIILYWYDTLFIVSILESTLIKARSTPYYLEAPPLQGEVERVPVTAEIQESTCRSVIQSNFSRSGGE
jgi:hypothetical protein